MAERIEAIAIPGLGEIVPGDDLPTLIAEALAATTAIHPLRDDDALVVTLLPRDPDTSADRIRAAIRERLGHDLPIIVSDSFGRPWRLGIVDVAIGVSGLLPLDDLRGEPDADGRTMRSTVRAVADELASAAELVLGKTGRRPLGLVRGATFRRGEGRIADALLPAEMDLFR